jgi:multiple antibiotic resistance protein
MVDLSMILRIFFLLNPLSTVPILFIAQKKKMDVKRVALYATSLAFIVAIIFFFIGPAMFQIFGIDIPSFRAAGGLVTLLLGISMVREKKEEDTITEEKTLISLIATPLLTGPATLSYLILTTAELGAVPVLTNLILAFVLVGAVFISIAAMIPKVNLELIRFTGRLLGLFIVALGMEMLVVGVRAILFGS